MIYAGEAQLARWAETSAGGATVTFWLPDGDALEKFKLLTERKGKQAGQILAMVIKLVDESELPEPERVPEPKREKIGPLCRSAVELCKNEDFQEFAADLYGIEKPSDYHAKGVIVDVCDIASRKDLDEEPRAARRFAELMESYRAWIAQNRG
jgi:hypothetical protein